MNNKYSRDTVGITVLMIIGMLSLCYGIYKLLHIDAGYPCAVEVQFKDSKAIYIGKSV